MAVLVFNANEKSFPFVSFDVVQGEFDEEEMKFVGRIEKLDLSKFINTTDFNEKDKQLIPGGNIIEVRYEDIEEYSLNVLEDVYTKLNLPDFEYAKQNFITKLQDENSYKTFEYMYSEHMFNKIESRWNKYIEQWNKKDSEMFINEYTT